MHIDELIAHAKQHINTPQQVPFLSIPKSWGQGRTVFGGISTALIYTAIKECIASGRVLRSLNTNFIGPLAFDTPFTIEVEVLREGRSATQVIGKAIQNDKVCVMSQACFGVARDSKVNVRNTQHHGMLAPKKRSYIPQIPKVVPNFIQHFELAKHDGGWPFTGKKTSHLHGWMRFKEPPECITDGHLIAMLDSWPPTLLQLIRWPAPISTMSWSIEFIHPHADIQPTDWFAYQASTRQAADGYGHTEANVWDSHGELVAISRQVVAIFD
ncbi:acyl-CoA thioesterase [Echinimonas agarilytica]|nr:thioesterase family protein [Echinimonas agarilytica]